MEKITYTIPDSLSGITVKDCLKKHLCLSSTLITKVKFGGILKNGEPVTVRAVLDSSDVLTVNLPEEESENIEPIPTPIEIIYEDDYLLAVNKPKNMPVHPSRGNHLVTLANAVRAYLDRPFVFRAVNRLDRDTSGIVIIAKDQHSAARLSAEIKSGGFEKYYLALLESAPSESSGIINAPIERERADSIKRIVKEDGKPAITEYKIVKAYENGTALCHIRLHTGRTHQIRVHMAHLGTPLYNDFLYGKRVDENSTYELCCYMINFTHPITNQRIKLKLTKDDGEC